MASRSGHGGPRRMKCWMRCDKCRASGRFMKLCLNLPHNGCGGTWKKFDPRDEPCDCADPESPKCPHWTVAAVSR